MRKASTRRKRVIEQCKKGVIKQCKKIRKTRRTMRSESLATYTHPKNPSKARDEWSLGRSGEALSGPRLPSRLSGPRKHEERWTSKDPLRAKVRPSSDLVFDIKLMKS